MRRRVLAVLAFVCALAGVVFVLLALDVRTWSSTVARDDLRFRALPAHRALWKPRTALPGDPAAALLGGRDAIALRRAVQLFWYSRIGVDPETRQDLPALRAEAEQQLQDLADAAPSPHERSYAANLLGVLVVTTPLPSGDTTGIENILTHAAGYFRQAIRMESGNAEAKLNLELVLRVTKPGKGRYGKDARAGYGFGRGRGATAIGTGY